MSTTGDDIGGHHEATGGNGKGDDPFVVSRRANPFICSTDVPGDKSITHRALFFGVMNHVGVIIHNPSPALDCRRSLDLLRALGYSIEEHADCWRIDPARRRSHPYELTLDCGNSGTTARLAMGFLTGEEGIFTLVGDESLMRRPMERVAEPLRRLGAGVETTNGTMPVKVIADRCLLGSDSMEIEVASAQVHAALCLTAARSGTGIVLKRTKPMRDHTHYMSGVGGMEIWWHASEPDVDDVVPALIEKPCEIRVPGDLSSAAFVVATALLVPDSEIAITGVGLNPTRTAFLDTLVAMGARVSWEEEESGTHSEPAGTIYVRHTTELRAWRSDGHDAPSVELMMDELPLLALIGSQATGETVVRGARELRVKESDRIAATAALLRSLGIEIEELDDGFIVRGPQKIRGGATIDHHGDHRLAMLAAVAGRIAEEPVTIPDPEVASVSWPGFWETLMNADESR